MRAPGVPGWHETGAIAGHTKIVTPAGAGVVPAVEGAPPAEEIPAARRSRMFLIPFCRQRILRISVVRRRQSRWTAKFDNSAPGLAWPEGESRGAICP